MGEDSVLNIILKAKDEASKTIEGVSGSLEKAKTNVTNLSESFKIAGGIITGIGVAGIGVLGMLAKSAAEEQKAQANIGATLDVVASKSKISIDKLRDSVDKASDSYLKLGFDNTETSLAMAQALRMTNNVTDAQAMLAASSDYARKKGISLSDSVETMSKAYTGMLKSTKDLGIELPKGAKGMQAIIAIGEATAGQADAYSHTFAGAMETVNAEVGKFKETLGARLLPTITDIITKVADFTDKLNKLSPATYDTIVKVLLFGTAFSLVVGPLLIFISMIPALTAGFTAISGVALPVVAILALVALAGYEIYTNWDKISPIFNQVKDAVIAFIPTLISLWDNIKMQAVGVFNALSLFVKNMVAKFKEFYDNNKATFDAMAIVLKITFDYLVATAKQFWNNIVFVFNIFAPIITSVWKGMWTGIVDVLKGVWETIKGLITIGWGAVTVVTNFFLGVLTGDWDTAWKGMSDGLAIVWTGIANVVIGMTNAITGIIEGFLNGIIGMINALLSEVDKAAQALGQKANKFQIGNISIPRATMDSFGVSSSANMSKVSDNNAVKKNTSSVSTNYNPTTSATSTPVNVYVDKVTSDMDLTNLGYKIGFAVRNAN